jgi:hypothetical protein
MIMSGNKKQSTLYTYINGKKIFIHATSETSEFAYDEFKHLFEYIGQHIVLRDEGEILYSKPLYCFVKKK